MCRPTAAEADKNAAYKSFVADLRKIRDLAA
jgi:hypothetical protein